MSAQDIKQQYEDEGYFIIRGAIPKEVCEKVLESTVDLIRDSKPDEEGYSSYVKDGTIFVAEADIPEWAKNPEDGISRLANLHHRKPYDFIMHNETVKSAITEAIGPDIDLFQSQFIFKNPGCWGQPWHQDSYYLPLDKPQFGIWVALGKANKENGCLSVAPRSHKEPVLEHVADTRPGQNLGYIEVVDYDFSNAIPVEMEVGDVLVFHSYLLHRSEDNVSNMRREALVYHLAPANIKKTEAVDIHTWNFVPMMRADGNLDVETSLKDGREEEELNSKEPVVAGSFEEMRAIALDRFIPEAAKGMDHIFNIEFGDEEGYHLIIGDGTLDILPGKHAAPSATSWFKTKVLQESIMNGSKSGAKAFFMGRVRFSGDSAKLSVLDEILRKD